MSRMASGATILAECVHSPFTGARLEGECVEWRGSRKLGEKASRLEKGGRGGEDRCDPDFLLLGTKQREISAPYSWGRSLNAWHNIPLFDSISPTQGHCRRPLASEKS